MTVSRVVASAAATMAVVLASAGCTKRDCESDSDCPSTAYCDLELGFCFTPTDAGISDSGTPQDDAGVDSGVIDVDAGHDAGHDAGESPDAGTDAGLLVPGPRLVCGPDDWCWEHPLPQGEALNDVWMRTSAEAYAVGASGTALVRFPDGSWKGKFGLAGGASLIRIASTLSPVWVASTDTVFQLVEGPELKAVDGGTVSGGGFLDLWVSPNGSVWVTDRGMLKRYQNGAWSTQYGIDAGFLWTVTGTNDSNVWVAGDLHIAHRVGSQWQDLSCLSQACDEPCSWRDAWLDESAKAWIVGEGPGCGVRQNASGGLDQSIPAALEEVFLQVTGTSSSNVWVVGYEDVHRFDGGTWTSEIGTSLAKGRRMHFRTPDAGVAVGSAGEIAEWGGTGWTERRTAAGNRDLVDVSITPDGAVFATDGANLWRRQKGSWTSEALNHPTSLTTLWASSASDLWVGGAVGTLRHWDGVSWTTVDVGLTENIVRIRGSSASDVWLIGSMGSIKRFDGNAWMSVAPPLSVSTASDLDVSPSGDVAILAGTHVVARIGGSWGSFSATSSFRGVLVQDGAVWVFGAYGVLARWAPGDSLPTYIRPSDSSAGEIVDGCLSDANELTFVRPGVLDVWNGATLEQVPHVGGIRAIACDRAGSAIAVGRSGTVLGRVR